MVHPEIEFDFAPRLRLHHFLAGFHFFRFDHFGLRTIWLRPDGKESRVGWVVLRFRLDWIEVRLG